MRTIFLGTLAFAALAITAIFSASRAPGNAALPAADNPLQIRVEATNPWTNLNLNNQSRNFQFAIITDRTGGHRPGVFTTAVKKINLMQPEFVISVGDLIEGYSEDHGQWALEWAEFHSKISQLQMPFFYVPGNHDLANRLMQENWKRKFGRTYFDFRYHDVLFVALDSEDPPASDPYAFSAEQQAWLNDVLRRNEDVRWTFVFMHKPAWNFPNADGDKTGWNNIERALGNRKFTLFAGHVHNYAKFVRNGHDYIMLATTGGSSKLRGKADGEFDQIVWVTMRDNEPVIANLLLDGIEDKDLRTLPIPQPKPKN
ncbi:MAG: metallophosphoesterase [Planctomycetes bacterium]|nr:metallophosphoesterase [Planctomycetota bacterium]